MDPGEIREDLAEHGWTNISDDTLQDFADYLNRESNGGPAPAPKKRRHPRARPPPPPCTSGPDPECVEFEGRLAALDAKAADLDRQFDECLRVGEPPRRPRYGPLYRFNFENYKDPYPRVDPSCLERGYIKPPWCNAGRRRFPIYKSDVCYPPPDFVAELHENERKWNPYIPGVAATRQDAMRWKLRERMQYSHPDYHM
jgi:hypothetical protein